MPVELREITIHATRPHDPVGYVQFLPRGEMMATRPSPCAMAARVSNILSVTSMT
jgi:hypothetical protein